jgi:hypothetical protein
MKMSGLICLRAKNIILSILAVLMIVPVCAQSNFAFQKNISLAGKGYEFVASSQNYHAIPDGTYLHNSTPMAFFASSSSQNIYANEITSYSNKRNIKKDLLLTENEKEAKAKKLEISIKSTAFVYPKNSKADIGITQYSTAQLVLYAKVLKQYAKKNGFDTAYAFLSNMGMLSNKKRFFVINLVTLSIEQAGLVSHGRGSGRSVYDKQYSNVSGSNSTSLGRYKISGKYRGGYGEAYKMVGLDSSNRNAYNRNIVLHSMSCIPDVEGIMPACVSEGCPAVSSKFFSFIRQIIDSRKRPVLLWIFDSNLEELVVEDDGEQNNYKLNFAFQIARELAFNKKDYSNKPKKKYPKLALNSDINCAEQNNSMDKVFLTLKPGYALPTSSQSLTQIIANTRPASNQTFYSPVDIGYVFTKRRKNQYISH